MIKNQLMFIFSEKELNIKTGYLGEGCLLGPTINLGLLPSPVACKPQSHTNRDKYGVAKILFR